MRKQLKRMVVPLAAAALLVLISACLDLALGDTDPPENFTATKGGYTNLVRLTWDEVEDATIYHLYRAAAADGEYEDLDTTVALQYDDTDVVPGEVYYYRAKALGLSGLSEFSEYDSGFASATNISTNGSSTNGGVELEAPSWITATTNLTGEIEVNWEAVDEAVNYELFRAVAADTNYVNLATVTNNFYSDSDVTAGTNYWYRVRSVDADSGESDFSSSVMGLCQ